MTMWVLILIANIDRGGASVSVPMQSEQACVRAESNWRAMHETDKFYLEVARYAYCINSETGDIK